MNVPRRPLPLRLVALAIELVPLSAAIFAVQGTLSEGYIASVAFTTGIGWLVLGRWDVGVVFGVARGTLLIFTLVLAIPLLFYYFDCQDCNPVPWTLFVSLEAALYVLTTLASAAMLAWHAWRVPSWINKADEAS